MKVLIPVMKVSTLIIMILWMKVLNIMILFLKVMKILVLWMKVIKILILRLKVMRPLKKAMKQSRSIEVKRVKKATQQSRTIEAKPVKERRKEATLRTLTKATKQHKSMKAKRQLRPQSAICINKGALRMPKTLARGTKTPPIWYGNSSVYFGQNRIRLYASRNDKVEDMHIAFTKETARSQWAKIKARLTVLNP